MTDTDIEVILQYSKLLQPDLEKRFISCENFYFNFIERGRFERTLKEAKYCFYDKDVIAWYLYHLMLYNYEPQNCDMNLCSRIVPVFKTIGANLDKLKEVIGFKERYNNILTTKDQQSIDHLLCEIIIALAYYRYVSIETEFVPTAHGRTPDIVIKNGYKNFFVEVKKRIKNYEYQIEERKHWTRLSFPVFDNIKKSGVSVCYRIVFHKELETYQDNYLKDIFEMFKNSKQEILRNDDLITITQTEVKLEKTKEYLRERDLRVDTTQLTNMLFGYDFEKDKAITYVTLANSQNHPLYFSQISFASALIWSCDSQESINKHAKSLKKKLVEAVEQIPEKNIGAIHFIIESYEGGVTDKEIFRKLNDTINNFDYKNRNIQFLYLHFWKFRIPPDQNWLVDQDCLYWERNDAERQFLLTEVHLLNR